MKQLMGRARLPPAHNFVEQMVEGVLKPETWATVEEVEDDDTDDEGAENFNHMWVWRNSRCSTTPLIVM